MDCNPVDIINEYMPIGYEKDDSISYLIKYVEDLYYHYNNGFYNLAMFSFYYIYMAILHIYFLKYHRFNKDIINSCRQGKFKITEINPLVYYGVRDERHRIKLINNLSKEYKDLHGNLVTERNDVAHFSGIIVTKEKFNKYINNAITVINAVKEISLDEFTKYESDIFYNRVKILINFPLSIRRYYKYPDENEIVSMINDFYISKADLNYFKEKYIYLNKYIEKILKRLDY